MQTFEWDENKRLKNLEDQEASDFVDAVVSCSTAGPVDDGAVECPL